MCDRMRMHRFVGMLIAVMSAYSPTPPAFSQQATSIVDVIQFGNSDSEKSHMLRAECSDVVSGGLGEPARRLTPTQPPGWAGGQLAFSLKVDPARQNYLTIRLWGDDVSQNRLILYCDGKQIGYRHLGDIDILDFGTEEPGYNGRFYYNTSPLPIELTKGNTTLKCEIRSSGPLWGYGVTFDQYQKPMKEPTRGIYALYTHTDGYFHPPDGEKQGIAPLNPPVRAQPGVEVLEKLKQHVGSELSKLLAAEKPLNQVQVHLLARAYHVKWTPAFHNPKAVEQIIKACDAFYVAYKKDPKFAQSDPAVYNSEWFGLGMAGDAVRLLASPFGPALDQPIAGAPDVTRRAGWSEMFQESRDWHRFHRRQYTNQSMIIDLNIYRANRAVAVIDPAHALPEDKVLHYLYESIGLEPWLGSDTDAGPSRPLGDNYFELTARGLSKELGYVGTYGEMLDWLTQIYDATRDPGRPGDTKIEKQLEKVAGARAVFRYPMVDAQGNRAMRMECIVGWRDMHFPGDVTYAERNTWDASPLYTAAATLDADAIGYSRQMLADNQFFIAIADRGKDANLRVTAGSLGVPDQFDALSAQPDAKRQLPMTPGQPDFVWSDEEDGVVAIKHGEEILYASLYWRARYAINFLARVHYITPSFSGIAVVREQTEYEPSGLTYTRPDWTNMAFGNGGFRYPGELHSAHAGERLPIARIPAGVKFKVGDESAYAGRGSFYTLRYGPYLIGMNCEISRDHELQTPGEWKAAIDLNSGKAVSAGETLRVGPRSTMVVYEPTPK